MNEKLHKHIAWVAGIFINSSKKRYNLFLSPERDTCNALSDNRQLNNVLLAILGPLLL